MNKNIKPVYPGFTYKGNELSAFAFTIDTFIISLKNGGVVNHKPDDTGKFYKWLIDNGARDITNGGNIKDSIKK